MSWLEVREDIREFDPAAVSTPTLTEYRSHLRTVLGLKPATINRHLVSLKRYFRWATDAGLVARDPAKAVKLMPSAPVAPRNLDDREESALVAAVTRYGTPRDRVLVVTALYTGLRVEELCGLKPEHVVINRVSGYLKVWGKRGKYREMPLNSTAHEALASYMEEDLPKEAPCLFPSKKGRPGGDGGRALAPITPRALGYIVARYAKLAGVEDVSPHDLRHRFGYRMAKTVPLDRLAQIMGHDSLDTTMIYVKGTGADMQVAIEEKAWA
jgi:integrase/recombinase XerC